MKELARKFYAEPVFCLAVVQAVAVAIASYYVSTAVRIAAGVVVAVCVVVQRQLVTPTKKGK